MTTSNVTSERRSVFITGSSSGLGLGLAAEFGRQGWHVIASMRDPKRRVDLDRAWAENEADGPCDVVELDVSSRSSIASGTRAVAELTGGAPDLLILNAGVGTIGFFEDISYEQQRQVLETNLFGAIDVAHAFVPAMRRRGSGRIVVVSSNSVNVAHPMMSMYAASKWGIEGWAESIALELAPFGVEVMIAQPGAHGTKFGTNVVPVLPPGSAYADIFARVMPRLQWIAAHQRDPARAVRQISDACTGRRLPFRIRIGPDDKVCAAMTRYLPVKVRHAMLRRFLDLPGGASRTRAQTKQPLG